MIKNLIIGSSFSCLGGALAFVKKKEKATIILGCAPKKIDEVFDMKLPTRNWSLYENNIKTAFHVSNFNVNKKYNFISYLGPGGLSNIWGKIINENVAFSRNIINSLIKKLKIKITKNLIFKKYISLYEFNNFVSNPIKILKKYPKKISIIKNVYVVKINYDYKKKSFILFLSDATNIRCKKLYLASGIFSSISLIKSLFKNNFNKKNINISHNNLLYGFSLINRNYFIKNSINKFHNYYYFDNSYKKFCGRISILNNKIIRKYNLNFFFKIIFRLSIFLGHKVLILNLMYKRKNNTTKIMVDKKKFFFQAKYDNNKKIITLAKNMLSNCFKSNFYFPFKSRIGSDFHYSANILKNINFTYKNKSMLKKLFILDSSCVKNKPFFPVFFYIINSYYRVFNNIHLLKLSKII
jgi:hypothetical protein